jgi:hypothetical protein
MASCSGVTVSEPSIVDVADEDRQLAWPARARD